MSEANNIAGGCPVQTSSPGHGGENGGGPVLPGRGETDYERYMRVEDLLELQKPTDDLLHPDELMFQVLHQQFELWCKLILHEMGRVGSLVDEDRIVETYPLLRRITEIIRNNTESMHVLETMSPRDFHTIREGLGQGSGSESPGFRNILETGPRFWPHVAGLMQRRGADLDRLYLDQDDPELLQFLELLTDFDMFFHIWRLNHLAMVKRVIGRDVKSLKGYQVHQLEEDVQMVLWPELWKLRERVTEATGTSPD